MPECSTVLAPFGRFPFDLTETQEKRAARLHGESIVIDLMFQGPCGPKALGDDLLREEYERWRADPDPAIFLDCVSRISALASEGALPEYDAVWAQSGLTCTNLQVLSDIVAGDHAVRIAEIAAHPWYGLAQSAVEIVEAKSNARCVSFLNHQYVPATATNNEWFERAYELGLRMTGLTYNKINQLGAGFISPDHGLTELGKGAVATMNRIGMAIDVAHAGRATLLEACRMSTAPVVCSHSGAAGVFEHRRNKSDEELKAVADTGGVIGATVVPMFMTATPPGNITLLFDHIDYIANLVGIDAIAIGTDWPLQIPAWVSVQGGPLDRWTREQGFSEADIDNPDIGNLGFDDYRDWPNITRGLVARGFTDEEIAKIIGGNALRALDAVWR